MSKTRGCFGLGAPAYLAERLQFCKHQIREGITWVPSSLDFSLPTQITKLSRPQASNTCFDDCRHVFHFLAAFWATEIPSTGAVWAGVLGGGWAGLLGEHPFFSAMEGRAALAKLLGAGLGITGLYKRLWEGQESHQGQSGQCPGGGVT